MQSIDRTAKFERRSTVNTLRSKISPVVLRIVTLAMATSLLMIPVTLAGTGHARAADGITTQTVASVADVGGGGQLVVMRMVIEPGVTLAAHSHSGSAAFVVVSGTLQTTLVRGGAAVNRNGLEQVAELGATMNLSEGAVISYSPNAVKTVANLTSKQLVLMASMLLDPNEPMVVYEGLFPMAQPEL
jgi:quercetin dioxygenase-like cupin family protein